MPRPKQVHNLAREYEAAHPFPAAPVDADGPAALAFNRAVLEWILAHPLMAQEAGRRFASGNLAFWNQATAEECARLGSLIPDHA